MAPEKITEKMYMEILGNAFWLSKKSKLHCKYYNVCGFFSRISQGILLGQYTLIRNDDDIPLAFSVVIFTFLNKNVFAKNLFS
jgi:hemolysin-activating ACP:hemolysin acyltransferase